MTGADDQARIDAANEALRALREEREEGRRREIRRLLRNIREQATRTQRGCTDEPEYLSRDLVFIHGWAEELRLILEEAEVI